MGKSDKELAVDVAIAYINASGNAKAANGISPGPYNVEQIENIIKHIYMTLENLGSK